VRRQEMRRERPLLLRQDQDQLSVDLVGVVGLREPQPLGDAEDVGVDGDRLLAEGVPQHDIGGLEAHAGQRGQPGARPRPVPAMPTIERAFARKKPVEWISPSSVARSAAVQSGAVRYFRKSAGVTMFTRSSVHWAARIVATTSSSGVEKLSAILASG